MFFKQLNQSLNQLQPSAIRSFNDKISGIPTLIRLTIGEPDFPTPSFAKEAAVQSIQADLNGYSHSSGHLELRQAIAAYVQRKYDLTYNPESEIIVTAGATEGLFSALFTLCNPGDQVLVPAPHYVCYLTQSILAGVELIPIDVSDSDFKLTAESLEKAIQTNSNVKGLILNHPCNPTGVTYNQAQLESLVQVLKAHQLWVISDEIYAEFTYESKHVSMAKLLPEQTILINGTSKSHAMTGWRSCFVAGPEAIIKQLFKVHQSVVNTPSTQAQYASIAAYNQGDQSVEEMRLAYKARRDYLITTLQEIGFETLNPEGAFYLFVKKPNWYTASIEDFCFDLANEAQVGVIPGSAFGQAGQDYFRISYASSMEDLQEAMNRLALYFQSHQQ